MRIRKCVRCAAEFTPSGTRYKRHLQIACTEKCRSLYERARVEAVIGNGLPLIQVFDEHVFCNVCGKSLQAASRHLFSVHEFGTPGGMTKSEMQIIYGLEQGARTIPHQAIERLRERGLRISNVERIRKVALDRNATLLRGDRGDCPPHVVMAPKSERQLEVLRAMQNSDRQGGLVRRLRGNVTILCAHCSGPVTVNKYLVGRKKYCSSQCFYRVPKRQLPDRTCPSCKKFFRPKSAGYIYCSRECHRNNPDFSAKISAANRVLPDKHCPECHVIFRPANAETQYCSRECFADSRLALTEEDAESIRKSFEQGISIRQLAMMRGLSPSPIRRILGIKKRAGFNSAEKTPTSSIGSPSAP